MKNQVLSFCLFFAAAAAALAAEVDYTNQFFAAGIKGGKCFVFIYDDGFIFVKKPDKGPAGEPVRILFNKEKGGLDKVFIVNDIFFMKIKNTLYGYELNKLLNPASNGKKIGSAVFQEISNVESLDVNGNVVYYKTDTGVYKYEPTNKEDNKGVPIAGINPEDLPSNSQIAYNPISRNKQFVEFFNKIKDAISGLSNPEGLPSYTDKIKKFLEKNNPDLSSTDFNSLVDDCFKSYYAPKINMADWKNLINYSILENKPIDNIKSQIKSKSEPSDHQKAIRDYYENKDRLKYIDDTYKDLKQAIEGVKPAYKKLKNESLKLILNERENEKSEIEQSIETNIKEIKNYIISQCRNRLYEQLQAIQPDIKNYLPQYKDFCIVDGNQIIINGYKIGETVKTVDFADIRNDKREYPRLVVPSSFSYINVINNAVYVLIAKDKVLAFDTTQANIASTRKEIDISKWGGVFYLVPGGSTNDQYIVSKNGNLLKLSLSGKVAGEGAVQSGDTVLIEGKPCILPKTPAGSPTPRLLDTRITLENNKWSIQ